MTLTNRIKEFRIARGLTLLDVAEAVGASNQQISHLENDHRRLTTLWLERLAEVFNCHPLDLISNAIRIESSDEEELLKLYRRLNVRAKKEAVRVMREI